MEPLLVPACVWKLVLLILEARIVHLGMFLIQRILLQCSFSAAGGTTALLPRLSSARILCLVDGVSLTLDGLHCVAPHARSGPRGFRFRWLELRDLSEVDLAKCQSRVYSRLAGTYSDRVRCAQEAENEVGSILLAEGIHHDSLVDVRHDTVGLRTARN